MSVFSRGSSCEVERWWARLPFRHIAVPYAFHTDLLVKCVLDQTPMNWCFVSLKGGNSSVVALILAFESITNAAPLSRVGLQRFVM